MPVAEQSGPRLLVSVRSVAEADSALRGGADLIDVKEPARGPLGKADDATIAQVSAFVAGRRQVSAALGELIDHYPSFPDAQLDYVKWGLRGCRERLDWRGALTKAIQSRRDAGMPRVVVVAYADWRQALSPRVDEVAEFACRCPDNVFMIDTFSKQRDEAGRRLHLLDWLSLTTIHDLCRRCRDAGVKVALAGSLEDELIARLSPVAPDWFAVRGAVCQGGERQAVVNEHRVRELAGLRFAVPGNGL